MKTWEEKLSLFADDMLRYTENPKDATRKLLELINESGKIKVTKSMHNITCILTYQQGKFRKSNQESNSIQHCNKKKKIPRNKPT